MLGRRFNVQRAADCLGAIIHDMQSHSTSRMECPQPVLVRDNAVATHLYRIAQEAVNNAVKHSRAGSMLNAPPIAWAR